ncbi:LysO family transporter [Oceanispirochaeta sp.]|uniref:LysO family transporter n=1 Tax=Oceanispirochaeta sp. TaxID=2035350 RepID=UPI002635E926|nr:LysO family transporter [Oceanispirochaeta sp.]MDA3958699.1 LysO family transporter [Oceanispirochaeta sp.]
MLTVIIIMTLGMAAGFILRKFKRLYNRLDKTVSSVIYLLLFLLGVSVGQNKTIINNFHLIGLKALIITSASVFGSLVLAALVFRFFFKQEQREDPDSGDEA